MLEKRLVLQHFIDSASGSLFVGMKGVTNQIGIQNDLDMKIRVLLGVEIKLIEEAMKKAGIDMDEAEQNEPNENDEPGTDGEEPETSEKDTEAESENNAK